MISDTHCNLGKMIDQSEYPVYLISYSVRISSDLIPYGDILIHAGDITTYGDAPELIKFNDELGYYDI